ncbi:restriction endonuclease subunit S [Moraxella lacunata]|uniref:restriction endonuclease subunit S n=1 Tax=Moraxella lacunata TaxID=477 RepID=UPI0024A61279|nr:restriction endonuclease subunit S [Moraxella lacunata]MDI4482417.1 restriction endonuclease subunit S [Moraxella lacunata]
MSEVSILDVLKDENLRLEAEFHTNKSIKIQGVKGSEIIDFVQYGTSEELNEDSLGYPILRLNEFDGYFIGEPSKYCNKISEQTYQELRLKKGDVLICRTNGNPKYVGKSAVVMQDYDYAYASYLFRIRPNQIINSETLVSFLNSKYGRQEIERFSMQSNQSNFSPAKFREITIPIIENSIQKEVAVLFKNSFNDILLSKQKYAEAEALLLENLGLTHFQATCKPFNIKYLKESFLQTGRLDSEFYQPIYELLENHIFSHSHGFEKLGNICQLNDENYTPKDNQEYDYIELSNIGKSGEVTGSTRALGKELPSRARRKVQTNQVMISSIEGSLQSCAIVPVHYDNALCSTGFYVLSSDKINAETLLVLFKSSLMQQILKKNCSGTILTAINKEELLNIPLPIIDEKIQTQIAEFIRQSNELRKQATQLLAQAKYSVEAEIEQSALQERERERERERFINEANYHLRLAEWVLLESLLLGQPKNISVQSFSQSFGISGRLDAEYYQPKYKRLLQKLKQYRHKTLGELVDLQKSVEVGSENYRDEGLPFVRVADFSKFGISQTDKFVNPADFADIIRPKKDTILLSKDGTVGIAYCVPSDLEVITSGAIVHLSLKTDEILPDYLALVLNSEAVQLQAQRDAGGSIIQHWKPSEILEVVIPVLPKEIQQTISDKVQTSSELKNQSEILLEQAKILVENEIENMG